MGQGSHKWLFFHCTISPQSFQKGGGSLRWRSREPTGRERAGTHREGLHTPRHDVRTCGSYAESRQRVASGLAAWENSRESREETAMDWDSEKAFKDKHEYTIRAMERRLRKQSDGTLLLDAKEAQELGVDPGAFANLVHSLEETNRRRQRAIVLGKRAYNRAGP